MIRSRNGSHAAVGHPTTKEFVIDSVQSGSVWKVNHRGHTLTTRPCARYLTSPLGNRTEMCSPHTVELASLLAAVTASLIDEKEL